MNKVRFNGWVIYWGFLLVFNFLAFAISASTGDFWNIFLTGFMILFCGIALSGNLKKEDEG